MKLADRVCVITGGARGIGEAIAARFIAEGATVAILDLDLAAAEETAIAAVIYAHGRVDVLCNNAGIGLAGPSETFSDEDWDTSIGVMQTGVFLCSQVVGRHMLERGRGTIVNTRSMNAWEAFPMRLAY